MDALKLLFSRGIPAYFWLSVVYSAFVMTIYATTGGATDPAVAGGAAPLYERVEEALRTSLFSVPLFSGNRFAVSWTVVFITLGFLCAWIEVVRATNVRATARNDTWSLIVTIAAFILFVGLSPFGTTAFLIVALVGFGDVLLDRYVGQAVARRDFGGMFTGGEGGGAPH